MMETRYEISIWAYYLGLLIKELWKT